MHNKISLKHTTIKTLHINISGTKYLRKMFIKKPGEDNEVHNEDNKK